MRVRQIDHFSIRTTKATETVHFFCDVLGLEKGFRPPFKFPGAWLYANGEPIVHILDTSAVTGEPAEYPGKRDLGPGGTGSLDHVALLCEDLPAFRSRLSSLRIAFQERQVPETRQRQLFLKDPNGITIELNFPKDA